MQREAKSRDLRGLYLEYHVPAKSDFPTVQTQQFESCVLSPPGLKTCQLITLS